VLVVLGADTLVADFRLESNALRILQTEGSRSGLSVVVPEAAVSHAAETLSRQLRDLAHRSSSLSRELRALTVEHRLTVDVNSVVHQYLGRLHNECGRVGWKVLPPPSVSHEAVLARLQSSDFSSSDVASGYVSVLLWETVKYLLPGSARVMLVSADPNLVDRGGGLRQVLRDELDAAGVASLEVQPSLKSLIETQIAVSSADDFWATFDESVQFDIEHAVAHEMAGRWLPHGLRRHITPDAAEAWVNGVSDMSDVMLEEVRSLGGDAYTFEFSCDATTLVEWREDLWRGETQQCEETLIVSAEGRWDLAQRRPRDVVVTEMRLD
jgi:hypothetical protein